MSRGTLQVTVNGRVLEPNAVLWGDVAGPCASVVSFPGHCWFWLHVSFWCWLDTGRADSGCFLLILTHIWMGNVCWQFDRSQLQKSDPLLEKKEDFCKKRRSARTLNVKQQIIIIINFFILNIPYLHIHVLPMDYKHCSFFFLSRTTSVLYKFLHDWFWRITCNILKHNRGRPRGRPTKTFPKLLRDDLVDASYQALAFKPKAGKRPADGSAGRLPKRGSKGNRHEKTHMKQPSRLQKRKRPTHMIQREREHQQNQKHFISHWEYIISWGDSIWF